MLLRPFRYAASALGKSWPLEPRSPRKADRISVGGFQGLTHHAQVGIALRSGVIVLFSLSPLGRFAVRTNIEQWLTARWKQALTLDSRDFIGVIRTYFP